MFFLICFLAITLIASRCWIIGQLDRKQRLQQAEEKVIDLVMQRYERMEEVALEMIEVCAESKADRDERVKLFYKDNPPPMPRAQDLRRVLVAR